jgi:hypothetical protein
MTPDKHSPFAAREARQWALNFAITQPAWKSVLTRVDSEPTKRERDELLARYGAESVTVYAPGASTGTTYTT